jgi:cytochrome P450
LARDCDIEIMSSLGDPFAAWLQCAFMGWPTSMRTPLAEWGRQEPRRQPQRGSPPDGCGRDEFDSFIREQLNARRSMLVHPTIRPPRLLAESVDGVQLSDAEIVSIIRNWTVGELATIAAAVGIALNFLAEHPDIQRQIRSVSGTWMQ